MPTPVCVDMDDVEGVDPVEDEGGSVSTLNGAGDCAWSPFGIPAGVVVMCIEGRCVRIDHGREPLG